MISAARRMRVFHGFVYQVAAQWRDGLAGIPLQDLDQWTRFSDGYQVGHASKTNCFRVDVDAGKRVFFKRYVYRKNLWNSWCRPAKAAIEIWGYGVLTRLGVPVPEVLAWGEYRRFGFIKAAFIVTKEVEASQDLITFTRESWANMGGQEKHRLFLQLSKSLLDQLQLAHSAGFFHHDLKWRNLLVCGSDNTYAMAWIDCPHAHISRVRSYKARVAELSALARVALNALPRTSQLRFLHAYVQQIPGTLNPDKTYRRKKWHKFTRALEAHLSRRPPRGYLSVPGEGKIRPEGN